MKLCNMVVAVAQSLSVLTTSHICGRIIGHQFGIPDAFSNYFQYTRIEDPYVDGVVITRGTDKEHVWTFAAANTACMCLQ